jgi:hypothetical protein
MTEKIRHIGDIVMNSDQAHQRAERNFKKEERARDGRQAMIEYEVQVRATRAKTERLKALRFGQRSPGPDLRVERAS